MILIGTDRIETASLTSKYKKGEEQVTE